jgi:flavin reductase (DIM6/NTAB) family NADH-FMN oxidoreductase RutF
MKLQFKPGNMIYPVPAAMISCGKNEDEYNIITVSWLGTICTNPPMCYISLRPERHSYPIIKENKEFVINLTNEKLAFAADWCGVKSGKDYSKFTEMKLTPQKTNIIDSVFIEEAPLSIECKVKEIIPLGSHHMFIAEVVNVLADDMYMDKESGSFLLSEAKLISYNHGGYFKTGDLIGKFGWSVRQKKKKNQKKK